MQKTVWKFKNDLHDHRVLCLLRSLQYRAANIVKFYSRSYHTNPPIIFCVLSVKTQNIFVDKCL